MPMIRPTIGFLIKTKLITDAMVRAYINAQRVQLDRDFAPIWGSSADCLFIPDGATVPPGVWQCVFLDTTGDAQALGFHDLTNDGMPIMKIGVGDDLQDGLSFTVTASHEVLECLVDPEINNTIPVGPLQYAREVADCCEDDSFSYNINGISMSAFATPKWFDPDATEGPFTFPIIPEINAPFALGTGGYIGILENGVWTQKLAQGAPGKRTIKHVASRTMRRFRTSP